MQKTLEMDPSPIPLQNFRHAHLLPRRKVGREEVDGGFAVASLHHFCESVPGLMQSQVFQRCLSGWLQCMSMLAAMLRVAVV